MSLALGLLLGAGAACVAAPRRPAPGKPAPGRPPPRRPGKKPSGAGMGVRAVSSRLLPRARRRRDSASGVMIATLAQVLALVGAGQPLERAWREVAGVSVDVDGAPSRASLDALAGDHPGDRRAADALVAVSRLSASVGAPVADALARLRETLEAEEALAVQRATALAGPVASARILTWLPIGGVVLGLGIGADPVGVLLDGGLGSTVMCAGLGFHLLGRVVTRRLVRSAERAGDDS